jgi:hypothetical protein
MVLDELFIQHHFILLDLMSGFRRLAFFAILEFLA